jgi:hypothetical protein
MAEFLEKIIIPYVQKERAALGKPTQEALCLFDVFAAHRTSVVKDILEKNNIKMLYIPAGCTG